MVFMRLISRMLLLAVLSCTIGCLASKSLFFPKASLSRTQCEIYYDVNGNGRADFALQVDEDNSWTKLAYLPEQYGPYKRIYHINDYEPNAVPHLIILLDSIPFQSALDFYNAGGFRWFPPPQKVIAPFPTLSAVIYNQILQAPPLAGTNNYYYDQRTNRICNRFWDAASGGKTPWQHYLHYNASYLREGLGFVLPRKIYRRELASIKKAFDQSPDRVTIVYAVSSAGMVCKYGKQGINECLQELERLCLQLLWERQGALKISIVADHGHNLIPSQFLFINDMLSRAGFTVKNEINSDTDIVIDTEGLVTYVGLHTRRPADVADALLQHPQMQLALYMDGDRVIVRDNRGSVAIEKKGGKIRYLIIDRDVLDYQSILSLLAMTGKADTEGFATSDDWFNATVDHEWPDAPPRIWDAFHGQVVSPSDLMITLKDGYLSGNPFFKTFIDMASSHGGLNQVNSATFLLSMTGRAQRPLRSNEVMQAIEPGYEPVIRSGK